MAELPKQELLIKLLGMTTAGDNEALVAIRKANGLLHDAGWSWEQLIRGKITVVEDPFNSTANPFDTMLREPKAAPAAPRAPQAPTPPRAPSPPNVPFHASNRQRIGIAPNKFVAFCYCCGSEVVTGAGFWFRPDALNPAAINKISVVCTPCSTTGTIHPNPTGMRPSKKRGKYNINDLV